MWLFSTTCLTILLITSGFNWYCSSMTIAANYWYAKTYFNSETIDKVQELITDLKNEHKSILRNASWLEESEKNVGVDKINNIEPVFGYPEEYLNDNALESYYDKLQINFNTCLQATLSANKFQVEESFKNLNLAPSNALTIYAMRVTVDQVHYFTSTNKMGVFAKFLLSLVYDKDRPQYVNYATAGFEIGQKLIHSYDLKGGQRDIDGNVRNLWSKSSMNAYLSQTGCMIKHYQRFNISNNDQDLLHKNVADNGGLRMSYQAYESWVKRNGDEKKLPGIELNQNQMFWVSFAQTLCEKTYDDYMDYINNTQTVVAVSRKYRVLGILSNLEGFSKDFNCSLDAPMNPIDKCIIW